LPLQQAPPLQQLSPTETVTFFISAPVVASDDVFFTGHESPQHEQQLAEAFSPLFFIGHESPLQQQSSLSQQEAFASLLTFSDLAAIDSAVAVFIIFAWLIAKAATANPRINIAKIIFFFIFVSSLI